MVENKLKIRISFLMMFLFASCYHGVNNHIFHTKIDSFEKVYNQSMKSFIEREDTSLLQIKAKSRNESIESRVHYIGSIHTLENKEIRCYLVRNRYGYINSPHGNTQIVIVINKSIVGSYHGLDYHICAMIKNNKLYLKNDNNTLYTTIDMDRSIPESFIIKDDSCDYGEEYHIVREKS